MTRMLNESLTDRMNSPTNTEKRRVLTGRDCWGAGERSQAAKLAGLTEVLRASRTSQTRVFKLALMKTGEVGLNPMKRHRATKSC